MYRLLYTIVNLIRLQTLEHSTIRHGGKITWLEKENQVADQKANPEKLERFNAQNAVESFLRIKQRNIPSEYL
jgi:hypothetical protein